MPQIYAIVSPSCKDKIIPRLEVLDNLLSDATIDVFGEEVRGDIAFTAIVAVYTRGEADLQIEVRLTTGRDEYHTGRIFDPTQEQWGKLAERFAAVVQNLLVVKSLSVWPKPYREAEFKFFNFVG